jgi:uncharacterized RDD family membrane protein YckC
MTDPAGGVPSQGAPVPPPATPAPQPAAAPAPPPAAAPAPQPAAAPAPPPAAAPAPQPAAAPAPPPAAAPAPAPAPPPAQGGYQQAPQGSPSFTAPAFQQAAVEAGPAPGIAYADLVTRVIAIVIDSVILFVGYVVILIVLSLFGSIGQFLAALIYAGASAGYFVYLWTKQRATYGQKFQKLECVNAADGATLTQNQAVRRWAFLFGPNALVLIVSNLPILGLALLGSLLGLLTFIYYIYLLYSASQSPKRQGFHDVQAGTVVVKHI